MILIPKRWLGPKPSNEYQLHPELCQTTCETINLFELPFNRSQPGFQLPLPSPLLHLRHNPGPWLGCHSAPSGQGGQNMQICKHAKCKMKIFKKQNAKCKYANIIAPHQAKMSRICKYVNMQNTPQGVQKMY